MGLDEQRLTESYMLREYLQAAMDQATYEILPEDNTFYGEIPVLPGRLGQRG